MITGFKLGLEYGTNGTDTVAGRKIEVIYKDSQTKPDVGRNLLAEAYNDDHADLAVGGTSSAVALAMLPVAQENKKILIVEPAVADSITGDKWNRYIFRTGRNSSQDAISNAIAIGKPGTVDRHPGAGLCLRPRRRRRLQEGAGEDRREAGVRGICAADDDRFHRAGSAHFRRARQGQRRRKIIWVIWAGAGNPLTPSSRRSIPTGTGSASPPAATSCRRWWPTRISPAWKAPTYYYYEAVKNPVNDWLVTEHMKRFKAPPDFFTCGGFAAAMAVVAALNATHGNTDTETLIKAMEGMKFDTPKGEMIFRKEDHQALQEMFAFKIKVDPNVKWAIPELTRGDQDQRHERADP